MHCLKYLLTGLMLLLVTTQSAIAQENGESILDEAVEAKLEAKSPRDLDKIADMCEEAIEKGLEDSSLETAKKLWASCCFEHAELLSQRVFSPSPDRRWKFLRQQALERLEKTVELEPENADAWLMIAQFELLEGGDKESAEKAVGQAMTFSEDSPALQVKSLILRAQTSEDAKQSKKDIDKALKLEPENTLALRIRGQINTREEDYDDAIDDFAALAKLQDNMPMELIVLAQRLQQMDKSEQALKALDRAIEINDEMAPAFTLRAAIYMLNEEEDKALEDVSKAIELNPRDIGSLQTRARVYLQNENFEGAIKDIDKILTFDDGNVDAIYLRSFAYAGMEDFDAAIEDMQTLATLIPDEPLFRNSLAMMYNSAEKPEKAIELYSEALEEDPTDDRALIGRADARLNAGMHADAVKDYEKAMELDDEDDHILNNYAWLLATSTFDEVRDGKRAVELATKAAELTEHKQAHILSTLAAAYAETGDFEKAVEWSEKSVELAEDDEQKANLTEELESFKEGKPVRENEAEDRKKKADEDSDDDDSDDDN